MKLFNTSSAFILDALTLFLIPNVYASGCGYHKEKMAESECLLDDKKCLDKNEKKLFYEVEA